MTYDELDYARVAYRLCFQDDAAEAVAIALRAGPGTRAWAAAVALVTNAPPRTVEDFQDGF